jgi:hypothetical protein
VGWRFRKTLRVAPGIRVNIGKRSASLSVGGRGPTINLGSQGIRGTVGVPGTGLSYTDYIVRARSNMPCSSSRQTPPSRRRSRVVWMISAMAGGLILYIFS